MVTAMQRTATQWLIRLVLLSSLTLFALWLGSSCHCILPAARVEPQDLGGSHPRHLLVRYADDSRERMLLRFVDPLDSSALAKGQSFELAPPFLKWEGADKPVTEVGKAEWTTAQGGIINCGRQHVSHEDIQVSQNSRHVTLKGKKLPVYGNTVVGLGVSPDRQKIAIVSALGRPGWSVMPFLAQSPAEGPYCHQVFSLANGQEVGKAITITESTAKHGVTSCWTEENRHVVYWDEYARTMWVVKVGGH